MSLRPKRSSHQGRQGRRPPGRRLSYGRMVYAVLSDELANDIYALALKTLTSAEDGG